VSLDGTLTQLNDLLTGNLGATIAYQALDSPSANTTLTLAMDDLGNTGAGGPLTATDTTTLIITAENDAPNATITPDSYGVAENTPLALHGTGLTVSDPDASTNPVRVTLSVAEGTLAIAAGTTGVTVSGSGSSAVSLDGTLMQLNDLLTGNLGATIAYLALDSPSASTTLTLGMDDLGNTGVGGPLTATATVTVHIHPAVEAPPVSEPTAPSLPEPTPASPPPVPAPPAQDPTAAPTSPGPLGLETMVLNAPEAPAPPSTPPVPEAPASQPVDTTASPERQPVIIASSSSRTSDRSTTQTGVGTPVPPLEAGTDTPETQIEDTQTRTSAHDNVSFTTTDTGFVQELDRLREEMHDDAQFAQSVVGSTFAMTTGLSIGYVLWLVRGGVLLSSVLTSLPAWRFIDPLPVLAYTATRSKEEQDDESLESLIKKGTRGAKSQRDKFNHP
jgi:type IV secretory pathway VirB2 component (pilin)